MVLALKNTFKRRSVQRPKLRKQFSVTLSTWKCSLSLFSIARYSYTFIVSLKRQKNVECNITDFGVIRSECIFIFTGHFLVLLEAMMKSRRIFKNIASENWHMIAEWSYHSKSKKYAQMFKLSLSKRITIFRSFSFKNWKRQNCFLLPPHEMVLCFCSYIIHMRIHLIISFWHSLLRSIRPIGHKHVVFKWILHDGSMPTRKIIDCDVWTMTHEKQRQRDNIVYESIVVRYCSLLSFDSSDSHTVSSGRQNMEKWIQKWEAKYFTIVPNLNFRNVTMNFNYFQVDKSQLNFEFVFCLVINFFFSTLENQLHSG